MDTLMDTFINYQVDTLYGEKIAKINRRSERIYKKTNIHVE